MLANAKYVQPNLVSLFNKPNQVLQTVSSVTMQACVIKRGCKAINSDFNLGHLFSNLHIPNYSYQYFGKIAGTKAKRFSNHTFLENIMAFKGSRNI
jgi:hypothetical protein